MKILLVAMSDSIHTVRWIRQIKDQGWEIHLFPSIDCGIIHPEMRTVTVHHAFHGPQVCSDKGISRQFSRSAQFVALLTRMLLKRVAPKYLSTRLARLIAEIRPDVVHSLEIQHAGYLTLETKNSFSGSFPPWIATNWGSDIYYFRQFPEHEKKIREVLTQCDYYSCECQRDVCLAEGLGLSGRVLPVFPNAGGFDLAAVERLRQSGPVHKRRTIMLKGYQSWAGRALVGLAALEQCADLLHGYEVVIHSASAATREAVGAFQKRTGVNVTIVPHGTSHESILAKYGQARVAIGLSVSDGISTSFLEGLLMGAFPIQSWTACADEWVTDGVTGLLVPPEDVHAVAVALRRALTDDNLVDRAALLNAVTARERLDQSRISKMAIDFYLTAGHDKDLYGTE